VIKADKDVPLNQVMKIVDIASERHLTAVIGAQPSGGP
jgi:biopolymer transport protein ExbD